MTASTLVIGGNSFIGRALVSELRSAGAASVFPTARTPPDGGMIALDLLETETVDRTLREIRPSVIFNLAAPARDAGVEELDAVVVLGARTILEAARRHCPGSLVVLMGSAAEYGPRTDATALLEGDPLKPAGPYASAKVRQTQLARSARRLGQRVIVARPFNVIGPGQPFGFLCSDLIVRASAGGGTLDVRDGASSRDLIDVRDVAAALRVISERAVQDEYNIGSGAAVTVSAVAHEIAALTGVRIRVTEPRGSATHSRADTTRIRSLAWSPRVGWRDSIREQVACHLRLA